MAKKAVKKANNGKSKGKAAKRAAVDRADRLTDDTKIVITAKGKTNPRREGTGPYKRYEALKRSRTVGDFLKQKGMSPWKRTVHRAIKEGLVRVA